jgi:hypothetical protein
MWISIFIFVFWEQRISPDVHQKVQREEKGAATSEAVHFVQKILSDVRDFFFKKRKEKKEKREHPCLRWG